MSILIDFGAICSCNVSLSLKSPKNLENPLLWRSRSSKVIALSGNQEPAYNFLLVINSNLCLYHAVIEKERLAKNHKLFPPQCNLATSFRVTSFEFMEKLYGSWN